jgi:hypothetical protein
VAKGRIHDEETVYRRVADAPGMAAMQLVLPNGRALAGADAMRELLRGIPRWRRLAALFDVPGMRPARPRHVCLDRAQPDEDLVRDPPDVRSCCLAKQQRRP